MILGVHENRPAFVDNSTHVKPAQTAARDKYTLQLRAAAAEKLRERIATGGLRDPRRLACVDCEPDRAEWVRGRAYRVYDHPRGYGRPFDVDVVCPAHLDARRLARGEPGARRGRPVKADADRRQSIRLTLTPADIAVLREWGNGNASAGVSHVLALQGRPQWARRGEDPSAAVKTDHE